MSDSLCPLSMGFSRQDYWSGLPFPSPGDLPNPGIFRPRSPDCRQILYYLSHEGSPGKPLLCCALCSPMDSSSPSSSVCGISQARILEWVVIFFSRGSSQLKDQICISGIGRWILLPLVHQEGPGDLGQVFN